MEKTLNKIVGDKIKTARLEKGLKQVDLSNVIGSTTALISNIENGGQSIHLVDLYKIAQLFKKEATYFLPSIKELAVASPSIDKEKKKYPIAEDIIDKIRELQIKKED